VRKIKKCKKYNSFNTETNNSLDYLEKEPLCYRVLCLLGECKLAQKRHMSNELLQICIKFVSY